MLAEYFHVDVNEMLTLWIADKMLNAVNEEKETKLTIPGAIRQVSGRQSLYPSERKEGQACLSVRLGSCLPFFR